MQPESPIISSQSLRTNKLDVFPSATPITPQSSQCRILRHIEIAPQYFQLTLQEEMAPKNGSVGDGKAIGSSQGSIIGQARAGHFVHILPRNNSISDPLLRRAFSILSKNSDSFEVLYRVTGRGTMALSSYREGDVLSVLGPLGCPFPLLSPFSILVGGGVGVPPLAMLAAQRQTEKVIALVGGRTSQDILCLDRFGATGAEVGVATNDGSAGEHGFVTQLLERHLTSACGDIQQRGADPNAPRPEITVFSCGPLPMLKSVARLAEAFAVKCYVSMEEVMPCGIGVCNGCVIPVRSETVSSSAISTANSSDNSSVAGDFDEYSAYRRTCVEGPVFDAKLVDWENIGSTC